MEATGEARAAGPEKANGPGRSSSFDVVYGAERAAIVRLAALLVGSQALAEELAHDAFVRLLERFDDVDNPAGFLRTVVVRLAVSSQRRHRTELRVVRRVGVDRATSIPEIDETWDALRRLDPDRRAVLHPTSRASARVTRPPWAASTPAPCSPLGGTTPAGSARSGVPHDGTAP